MSNKSDASIGQEICLILGQVSLGVLYWKKKLSRRIYVVWVETVKTADIQARSFTARTLDQNEKKYQAEGEAKVVT